MSRFACSVPLRTVALLLLVWGNCAAQSIAAPVETHLPLLAKVLEYDRAFRERIPGKVVLGVIYQSTWRPSVAVFDGVFAAAGRSSFTVHRLPVQVIPIDVSGETGTADLIKKFAPDVLYIAPVRGVSLAEIESASEREHCRTITGVPEFVEDGVAIGISVRNDRPLIVINLPAAKACGADLSAQVLRLAWVLE